MASIVAETSENTAVRLTKAQMLKDPTTVPGAFQTDRKDWEWVAIPAKDFYGARHAGLSLNGQLFEGGKKHFVPPVVAEEMRRILDAKNDRDLRSMRGERDTNVAATMDPSVAF